MGYLGSWDEPFLGRNMPDLLYVSRDSFIIAFPGRPLGWAIWTPIWSLPRSRLYGLNHIDGRLGAQCILAIWGPKWGALGCHIEPPQEQAIWAKSH